MLGIIIKLVISIGLPAIMYADMGSKDSKYDIIGHPTPELILLFILFALAIYFTCSIIAFFIDKMNSVIGGFFAGALVGSFIWVVVVLGVRFIFLLFGMGDDMFTDAHIENQRIAVAILDIILLVPLGLDIARVVKAIKYR